MTVSAAPAVPRPWAFWAPTPAEWIERALDLAAIKPGDRFLDLGCGDGRVLLAAARRGARVRGVELDRVLAGRARANLAAAGVTGEVVEADFASVAIEADVVYTYLTPATMARLAPVLSTGADGTRIVSQNYPISGWKPEASEGGCHLYRLPAAPQAAPAGPGWPFRAVVVVVRSGRRNLVPFLFSAAPGPITVERDGPLSRATKVAAGTDWCDAPRSVPVDVIFEARGAGTVIAGALSIGGHELAIAAVFAGEGSGFWRFGPDQGLAYRETLAAWAEWARGLRGGGGS